MMIEELAKESDIDSIVQIENQTFTIPWSKQSLLESIRRNEILVVKKSAGINQECNEIVAFLITKQVFDEASVLQIAVDPTFHRKGFGKKLLSSWLDKLPDEVNKVWIEVRESNVSAQALYKAKGFSKFGERKDYYRTMNPSQKETAYIFCLDK